MKYAKTELGQQAFKERSSLLSVRQRTAFIMFDGVKPVERILESGAAIGVTQADVDYLVGKGFLVALEAPLRLTPAPQSQAAGREEPGSNSEFLSEGESVLLLTPQERYGVAYPLATQLTASLGLRGFRLNLAVESASGYEDLLALLPKIEEAVGPKASRRLARVLKG